MTALLPHRGFAFYSEISDFAKDFILLDMHMGTADLSFPKCKAEIIREILKAVDAPSEYMSNANLDLLEETLRDLSWLKSRECFIVILSSCRAWREYFSVMSSVLEIVADAANFWHDKKRKLFFAFVE